MKVHDSELPINIQVLGAHIWGGKLKVELALDFGDRTGKIVTVSISKVVASLPLTPRDIKIYFNNRFNLEQIFIGADYKGGVIYA